MNQEQLQAYCINTWPRFFTVFLKNLQPDFNTRLNGHGMRYHLEGWPNDPYTHFWQGAVACKFEDYGKSGTWPNYDLNRWMRVYIAAEEKYHPLSGQADHPVHDAYEGWDRTDIQSLPNFTWSEARIRQFSRMTLSATLMGDGWWNGCSYEEDYYFFNFLRGGMPQYAPHSTPETSIQLGKARGGVQTYNAHLGFPVYYRRFLNQGTGFAYSVVHNPWNFEINGIPAEDGKWFYGDWPDGAFSESPLPPTNAGGGGSDAPAGGGGGGGGMGGCFLGGGNRVGTTFDLLLTALLGLSLLLRRIGRRAGRSSRRDG